MVYRGLHIMEILAGTDGIGCFKSALYFFGFLSWEIIYYANIGGIVK
jgi:hypothetical protein